MKSIIWITQTEPVAHECSYSHLLLMIICSVNGGEPSIYKNPNTEDDYEGYIPVVSYVNCYVTVTVVM